VFNRQKHHPAGSDFDGMTERVHLEKLGEFTQVTEW